MYLLYVFMDEIPGIIEALVGVGVKGPKADAVGMLTKSMGAAAGAATRLASLGGKVGGSVQSRIFNMTNLGKGKKETQDVSKGGDSAASTMSARAAGKDREDSPSSEKAEEDGKGDKD